MTLQYWCFSFVASRVSAYSSSKKALYSSGCSGRSGVGFRIFLHATRCHSTRSCHDIARLPSCWSGNGNLGAVWTTLISRCSALRTLPSLFANAVLLSPSSHSSPSDTSVEWAYVFDVHTNAFFPFFLTVYVAQLFLLPVILKDRWICLLIGNTLYLAG